MEDKNLDLIEYPYTLKHDMNIVCVKSVNGENYSIKTRNKIIKFDKVENKTKYYVVSLFKGGIAKITGEVNEYFKLTSPLDFIVPNQNFDKNKELADKILNLDIYSLNSVSKELNDKKKFDKSDLFDKYYPNILTQNKLYANYDFKEFKYSKEAKGRYFYKYGDPIPNNCSEENKKKLKIKFKEDFRELFGIYKNVFEEQPIWGYTEIEKKLYTNNLIKKYSKSFTKPFLSLVAYFNISGPWGKKWVKLGYDPKKDKNNYKFQQIILRKHRKIIQVSENPDIMKIIEKNKKDFLSENCEYESGFITKECISHITEFIKDKNILDAINKSDSEDYEGFDFN